MNTNLYPLVFEPILKERIWGGIKLQSLLDKKITSQTTGESWEISQVSGDVSILKNGFLQGKKLNELLEIYPEEILGTNVYKQFGKQFPLLFKFLDAREDLSIQVHPDDELAKYQGILGHFHIQTNKTDPGPALQWDKLVQGAGQLSRSHQD